jgi:lipopolysaccharide export system protein LptA
MRDRVARVRRWLAGGVFILLAIIVAFIGYGRYVSHLRHLKLPLPPGVNIVREGGGWTYSRTNGSKTLYTIHAANFEQGKNGKTALHDVSVVLYGKKDDRRDRLSGESFEYDEKGGVLRALGQVHIDLEGAAATQLKDRPQSRAEGRGSPNVIHVTTSGLVYLEKLGIAATSEDVDVQSGPMSGHARGADYSSDSGMLMLHSAVKMSGSAGGRPVRITAAQAQFDQRAQQARLENATYESDGRSISAEHAVLHRRTDGTLDKIDADGNVVLAQQDGKALARHAELQMNASGKPASALLTGNVVYTSNQPSRQIRGQSGEARVTFAANGSIQPEHAVFLGSVHMAERTGTSGSSPDQWNSRDLDAAKLEMWMAAGPEGRAGIRSAQATGNAKLVMIDSSQTSKGKPGARTELAADELRAAMSQSGTGVSLDQIMGLGHTSLRQVASDGVEQASQGDTLLAKFRPATASSGEKGRGEDNLLAAGTLVSAVQQGHVTMIRRLPARPQANGKPGTEEVQHASADRASYDAGKDQLLLSGAVRMSDTAGSLWAQQVNFIHTTGDAHATGSVKVDYTQNSGGEPMHILADRADVRNATSSAIFYGSPVRVWQNGNQVQAPEVEIDRENKQLNARGDSRARPAPGKSGSVRTMLVSASGDAAKNPPSSGPAVSCGTTRATPPGNSTGQISSSGAVRILSGGLTYSGASQQVAFSGGVRADTADVTIRAAQAIAYLLQDSRVRTTSAASIAGGLDRMVASGGIELTRAQEHVSGDQLVYEAAQRSFLLSGGPREPAKAVDARGTSTAAAFRFTACDDTLEALGQASGVMEQRVETESRAGAVPKREKSVR